MTAHVTGSALQGFAKEVLKSPQMAFTFVAADASACCIVRSKAASIASMKPVSTLSIALSGQPEHTIQKSTRAVSLADCNSRGAPRPGRKLLLDVQKGVQQCSDMARHQCRTAPLSIHKRWRGLLLFDMSLPVVTHACRHHPTGRLLRTRERHPQVPVMKRISRSVMGRGLHLEEGLRPASTASALTTTSRL